MTSSLDPILAALKRLPLPVIAARAARRLGFRPRWLRSVDFRYAPDASRPLKAPEILLNAMESAGLARAALVDRLAGATLLEIGCGPYAGFAPFAIAHGAERYIGIDPGLDIDMLTGSAAGRDYLARGLAAAGADKATDVAAALGRMELKTAGIADALPEGRKVDVSVSISCLEHIHDFAAAARAMAAASKPDTVHVHLVNFSSHLSKAKPFHDLYEGPYADFARKWNGNINGLRAPDLERALADAGLALRVVVLDSRPEALPAAMHESWTGAYDRDTLAVRTALFTSLSPGGA
ncbi:MAG TPA: methyltransferase domain-containing protein [Kaistiaceae bacterium]|nr:methyltransferase domain-containing protein [Kaistiaceae bacterium]